MPPIFQDYIYRRMRPEPTAEEMAEPVVEACRRTLSKGRCSPMARKGAKIENDLLELNETYCKNLSDAHSIYHHTAEIKRQINIYVTYHGRIVTRPGGRYKLRPEEQNIDQRTREDQENRWDMDQEERERWKYVMVSAKRQRSTSKRREYIHKIDEYRKNLDKLGIPNYVLTFFENDWDTIVDYQLMVFPTRGRSGPFTIERDDGIGAEVEAWLKLMRYMDQWSMRQMFINSGYFKPAQRGVWKVFSSPLPVKAPCIANETEDDDDSVYDTEEDEQTREWESKDLPRVDPPQQRHHLPVACQPQPQPIVAQDPPHQKEYPLVDWQPQPRPPAAQKRAQASEQLWRNSSMGLGHISGGFVSIRHDRSEAEYWRERMQEQMQEKMEKNLAEMELVEGFS